MQYFSEEDVVSEYGFERAIPTMESALRALAHCDDAPTRNHLAMKHGLGALIMPVYDRDLDLFIVKSLTLSEQHQPRISGGIQAFCGRTGQLIAFAEASELTAIRTAAAAAVATKKFAPVKIQTMAVFGTGQQALWQIRASLHVRNVETIVVFARDPEKTERFCKAIEGETSGVCRPGYRDELLQAELIILATNSREMLLGLEDLGTRVHINAVGSYKADMLEFDPELCHRAELMCVDHVSSCSKEAGELIRARETGPIQVQPLGSILDREMQPSGISLYKSVGHALLDLYSIQNLINNRRIAG